MYELIPILAGVAAGCAALRIDGTRTRVALVAVTALAAALVAGLVSGELAESPLFLLWDLFQCVVAAVLTIAIGERWQARARAR